MSKKETQTEEMGSSENPLERNREKLAELFPGVFSDGRVDCEELQKLTGIELEESKDRYGLSWASKAKCFKEIERTTTKTLRVDRDASVDFDTTENLFIEGDNLEALKVLQRSYYGKVKMIYIDPPYNTGHDFIYNDKFARSESEEGAESGTRDAEGNLTRTDRLMMNDRSKGRFHSNWLNMMYPRLYLARNLLKSDGVIFVSIDDNEVANLRLVMDEIFGEENFVASIIWRKKKAYGRGDKYIIPQTEYVLVYKKTEFLKEFGVPVESEKILKRYKYEDEKGKYELLPLWHKSPTGLYIRPTLQYELILDGKAIDSVSGQFLWKKDRILEEYKKGLVEIINFDGAHRVYSKAYLDFDADGNERMTTPISYYDGATTSDSAKELVNLFEKKVFDFSKPVGLIKHLVRNVAYDSDDIVLDFFAGSGTTAHAVMAQNAEDGGNRKWICVQLPEETGEESEARKAGFETISDISRERIRRAGKKIAAGDVGFKALKLGDSNFKVWNTDVQTEEQLQGQLQELLDSPYAADATEENMLNELILKNGLPLTISAEKKDGYYVMDSTLVISLVDEMTQGIFTAILAEKPTKIILLDTSFRANDQLKTNLLLQAKDQRVDNVVVV